MCHINLQPGQGQGQAGLHRRPSHQNNTHQNNIRQRLDKASINRTGNNIALPIISLQEMSIWFLSFLGGRGIQDYQRLPMKGSITKTLIIRKIPPLPPFQIYSYLREILINFGYIYYHSNNPTDHMRCIFIFH